MSRAAIFGAGSWGTAFGEVLCEAGTETVLWARRPGLAETITSTRENPEYLPGITLPERLHATSDATEALAGADTVVFALPSHALREHISGLAGLIPREALLVSLIKGVEPGTTRRMTEVIREVLDVPEDRVALVTGPNLSREVAMRLPAAAVVACTDEGAAARLQLACHTPYFRPYTNTDVVGCELGGAVKNVIALAVGMAEGLGLGDNAKASLITRGLAETARLGAALGADQHTLSGLAGLGDLVATCWSPLSRNRTFGENLGRGMTLRQVQAATRQTAEGVRSCEAVADLARKHDVDMPIVEHVVSVVHEGMPPRETVGSLMSRSAKAERHGH